MALLDDNLKRAEPKPIAGQGRSVKPYSGKSGNNPDWEGGQQRGPVSKQDSSSGRFSRPTIDQDYVYQAFREKMLGPLGIGKNTAPPNTLDEEENYSEIEQLQAQEEANRYIINARASARTKSNTNNRPRRQPPKINLLGGDVKDKLKATRITATNASWIGYTWLFVQLPLAVLSILCFGIVAGIDSLLSSDKTNQSTNFFSWVADKTIALASNVFNSIANFIGIDFAEIAFSIAMGLYIIILALGILSILTVYFQYVASGLKPTTGQGSGLKTGSLLLAIIGYSTPMLNLFPFVLLWMAAVWYHPK